MWRVLLLLLLLLRQFALEAVESEGRPAATQVDTQAVGRQNWPAGWSKALHSMVMKALSTACHTLYALLPPVLNLSASFLQTLPREMVLSHTLDASQLQQLWVPAEPTDVPEPVHINK